MKEETTDEELREHLNRRVLHKGDVEKHTLKFHENADLKNLTLNHRQHADLRKLKVDEGY